MVTYLPNFQLVNLLECILISLYLCESFLIDFLFKCKASLTNKHGGKIYFGGGIGVCAVLSLLMPLSAYLGPGCLIGLRIVQGLAQVSVPDKTAINFTFLFV